MNRRFQRLCSLITLLALAGGSAIACSGPDVRDDPSAATSTATSSLGASSNVTPSETPTDVKATVITAIPTVTPSDTVTSTVPSTSTAASTATETATPSVTPTATMTPEQAASVLPGSRVVSFYGHPNSAQMGILGESDLDAVAAQLREQSAAYAAADPSHPVVPALELIATVAQPLPGDDGTYLSYTGDEIIGQYADYAAANGMLLILDLQIGHSTVRDEIGRISHWLELPHVHVALDPEFSTGPDRVPGEFIGEVDGSRVQIAVEYLSELVASKGLPSKILIVHQFEEDMILNKSAITPLPGVDVVIDMDGFGGPDAKIQNYGQFVRDELVEYGGIKLFYSQDDPLLTPEQVVALEPPPLVVIYQ